MQRQLHYSQNQYGFTFFLRKKADSLLKLFLRSVKTSNGFTIIELLIAMAILLVIATLVIFSLRTFDRQIKVDSTGQNILSTLRVARNKTLASEGQTTYGVYFDMDSANDKYVLFTGSSYTAGVSTNKEYKLFDSEIQSVSLNGGAGVRAVVFDRIRGTTNNHGTITIRSTNDNNRTLTINISRSGQVSLAETVSTTGARVTDSRHLHFNLGWLVQSTHMMTLQFPGFQTENISLASFFTNPNEFSWSGTFTVDGSPQTLKVHSHCLNSGSCVGETDLCIHRDKSLNNKAVNISINGMSIVNYSDVGAPIPAGVAQ